MKLTENALKVLKTRYLARDEDGNIIETPEELFRRVASTIAKAEEIYDEKADIKTLEEKFYKMMTDMDFLPNSPTLMNAGRPLGQLSACFVLPVGDSMEEIFDAVKDASLIHKSGGGTGFSFSRIRPKGSAVKSTGGVASGPVSFMKVFNAATEAVKQGGMRRGANMGILRVDHPDILEFIQCKKNNNDITNFNISVGITEKFMQAVIHDQEYELVDPHTNKVTNKLRAREVFDLIVDMAWNNGEPGIIFLDRINRDNVVPELGEIEATNPCVTGDTWVTTSEGPRQVRELVGRPFAAVVNGIAYRSGKEGFFRTGIKPIVRLCTREGYSLRLTSDHRVLRVADRTRYRISFEWVPVKELKPGDQILLHNHRALVGWPGELSEGEGYLLGLLVGDGVLKKETAVLSVWAKEQVVHGFPQKSGAFSVMDLALSYALELPHRSDFLGWSPIEARGEYRLKSAGLKALAERMGLHPGRKTVTPEIERASSDGYRGFLRGLFDCDGSVQGNQGKGVSIRLAQSDFEFLQVVQRMLLRLGIVSTIYKDRRPAGKRSMPDGKGGKREYNIKAQHELVITGDNLSLFAERIGFGDKEKAQKLSILLTGYRRKMNRERFVATVWSVEDDGVEEVYDVQVPGINAFDANGIYAHNCGEQPLLPYESCNLGSINLANMLKPSGDKYVIDYDKLEKTVKLAVRFLDNVIDVNKYPLPVIEKMTKGTRKIGLGVMGFADMLIKLGIPYNSEEGIQTADMVMKFIDEKSKEASAELAEKRGVFPFYDKSVYKHRGIKLRNATTTTIAPTGSISIIAGVSSGIEPLFAVAFVRNVLDNQHLVEVNPLFKEALLKRGLYSESLMEKVVKKGTLKDIKEIPDDIKRVFVTAHDIDPFWHVKMQATFQSHTDNAVSKTVNFRHDASRDDVREVYMLAYELGCKGVTIYRDGSRDAQVINVGTSKTEREESITKTGESRKIVPRPRPEMTMGYTEKVRIGCGNLYVTVNYDDKGICEVFTNLGRAGGCPSQSEATSRLVSIALRSGMDVKEIVGQLKGIRCHSTIRQKERDKNIKVLSCPDAIAKVIEKVIMLRDREASKKGDQIDEIAFDMDDGDVDVGPSTLKDFEDEPGDRFMTKCPECGASMEHEEGCVICRNCGYSKCH